MKGIVYGQPIDYVVIVVYFVAILGFGSFFGRYTRTTRDFFTSGSRFSWWLIAMSCVSLVVGSYSFVKYSEMGYSYGFASGQTYLNDWFLAPLFILGWLPLIYYSRVTSIPEYFEKRFDRKTRIMAVAFIMTYMVGYIGINLYTMGVAIQPIIPRFTIFEWAAIIAVITSLYCAFGGQTAVIMTDLVQSCMLLMAGVLILFLGWHYLGDNNPEDLSGLAAFFKGLPGQLRFPFSGMHEKEFPMPGIFWQDFFGSSMFFYFANQGLIMRFQSLKSVNEGRKAIIAVVLILMPLAAISVASAGWVGRSLMSFGLIPADTSPKNMFIVVTELITRPGIFGFILAALIAALMSTIDSLINAVSAIAVVDIYKPFIASNKSDRHYLTVARVSSLIFTFFGLALVPVYMSYGSIYKAHAAFTAAISPPIIVVVILGVIWKRFSRTAAFWTMLTGGILMAASLKWPVMVKPFVSIHGLDPDSKTSTDFLRALYGMAACGVMAVAITLIKPETDLERIKGYWVGTLAAAKERFKGRTPNDMAFGLKVPLTLVEGAEAEEDEDGMVVTAVVTLSAQDAETMKVSDGDLVYLADRRWWFGGLKSLHATAAVGDAEAGTVIAPKNSIEDSFLEVGMTVVVEKII